MRYRLRTLLILMSCIAVLAAASFYFRRAAQAQQRAIDALSSSISLGMPRDRVTSICKDACAKQRGWSYFPEVASYGSAVAAIHSPLTFGGQNHVVYVFFENDAVAAVLVRTADTSRDRPPVAPLDRVDNPSRSLGTDFSPQ